ncbi:MAG: cob(I)yrinic acid a,c-diamide adenosyltransferase [Methylophilaceae bacterium]
MGNRLSKIVTRTGDDGTTGLGDGSRTAKDSLRVTALGDVDELNSTIGVLLTEAMPDNLRATLIEIQHDLFDMGGELCIPGHVALKIERLVWLEKVVEGLNSRLPPLKEFILPGGSRAAAFSHVARTVCRRAERTVVALSKAEKVSDESRQYLNRLSDFLFVLSRVLNKLEGTPDVLWKR